MRPVLPALTFCLALVTGSIALSQAKRPQTIKDLPTRKVEVRTDAPVQSSAAKAMENYRRFLELQRTDPELRAEALRRLADLNLESGELERMEKEVTQLDQQGARAIELYTTLLKAYPNYPRNDQVLYQLARAYETTGRPEQALSTLDRIVSAYPKSPQLPEVQFRRGELLFSAQRYREAQQAYAHVIEQGTRSAFYEQSLYKHGWSLFKQSLNEESLGSFARVLDRKLADKNIEALSRADRELTEDTLRVMSITFADLDGAQTLDGFLNGRSPRPAYVHLLYARLGDLLVTKQRYQDAAATYRAYVAREPNSDHAPVLAMQAIAAYQKGGFTQLVLEGKQEYVQRYHFDAPFWQGKDRAQHAALVTELKTNLQDVATHYHATAQKSKRPEEYQQAAHWYRELLKAFPEDADAASTRYLLAETLFESGQYAQAAAEYEHTAYDYPKNDKSATAAYAALVSYQKEKERNPSQADWQQRYTEAGLKFAQSFPEHPDSAGVLTRAAEELFAARDLPRAITVAESILARQPPVDLAKQRIAWTVIAQSHFDLGQFDKAEPAFVRARELAAPDKEMSTDLAERLAASVYKQGETKQKSGDAAGAVEDYLRVARVAPQSEVRATAQYDAATQLINLKDWNRAIEVLETFRREFPEHQFTADVTRKLAVSYTEAGRSGEAAVEFERIAGTAATPPEEKREALQQAANLYEKAGNATKFTTMLEKFVATYPTPVAEAMEMRQKLADVAAASGDSKGQQRWYREIINADAQAGAQRTDRTRYLAAKAQLALAAPARDAFRAVRLTAPLKKSLAAKRKALESATDAYKQAAEYRVSEVTTAATFEMAELYRALGRDVMQSERPKRLSAEELEQYDVLLEEQAFPFEEQAIALHEINAGRLKDGVDDEWVQKSMQALAELNPGKYGKQAQENKAEEAAASPEGVATATPGSEPSTESQAEAPIPVAPPEQTGAEASAETSSGGTP